MLNCHWRQTETLYPDPDLHNQLKVTQTYHTDNLPIALHYFKTFCYSDKFHFLYVVSLTCIEIR